MNKYELVLVVSTKIEDEAKDAVIAAAKDLVTKFGGVITNVEDKGRQKLAYEIQKMNEGYYTFIQFDAEPTVPAELEARLRIMENVLRYLCVRQDEE